MNDVNNRIFREFTEFFDNVEKSASEISVTTAYEITMKSTISTAIIVLESEGRLEERYWNHLRVQNNILDFLYDLWVGSCHSLAADFSTIMKDLVEYDFILAESIMKERMQSASGLPAIPKMFCSGCRMPVRPYSLPTATWGSWAKVSMS